ncbi:cytochrome c biogenesis protein CcdA [Brooklawnia sp.]|uniref:cytochrome c biogenesis CcdA family protein n=1 Tax=Brooklawnia sp. TaxID=2699740 RepID=UPI00311E8F54
MEVTIPLALLAGVVSFASPCFLPIVPAFVGQLIGAAPGSAVSKRSALGNTLSFVAGFSLVFIALWASIGLIGRSVGSATGVLRIAGGALLIVMGLQLAGLIDIGLLNRVARLPMPARSQGAGALRSGLMGLIFGAGWTPCIGPVLGGILALATVSSTSGRGIALMLAYCLGLGLPLILVALGVVRANGRLAWFTRHHVAVSMLSGGMLMLIGFLMITNLFARLAGVIPGIGI